MKEKPFVQALLFFVPYLIAAYALILVVFFILALLYMVLPVDQTALYGVTAIISVLIVVVVAFFAGRLGNAPGWFSGGIFGLLFSLIMCIAGAICGVIAVFSIKTLLILVTCFGAGAFGGILGVNTRTSRKRRRTTSYRRR